MNTQKQIQFLENLIELISNNNDKNFFVCNILIENKVYEKCSELYNLFKEDDTKHDSWLGAQLRKHGEVNEKASLCGYEIKDEDFRELANEYRVFMLQIVIEMLKEIK